MTEGRVLLVDDDQFLQRVYSRALRNEGLVVTTACDGLDGAQKFKEADGFDLIVSDIQMPNMSGVELLKSVREKDLDVPVILMTGDPMVESAAQAVEYGALRYLTKPIDIANLRKVASKAVRLHGLARAKRAALDHLGAVGMQLGDLAGLDAAFERVLATLFMAYQPIVSWSAHNVFAYEALMRSTQPTLPHPEAVLDAAERLQRIHDLGRVIRRTVAHDILALPAEMQVFVNLHTLDLLDEELIGGKCPLTAFAPRVVLEITERATLDGVKHVTQRVESLRKLGYRIALDDLGAGYAGLTTFAHLEPDIVKVDRSLVTNIGTDVTKQKLVKSFSHLCTDLGMQVVCEGVETAEERDVVLSLECDLLQGYLFAKPHRSPPSVVW
jgi:EAL domain-containing protein (putative c-di-GMP-specific phosphodiesterase class I)